MEQALSLVDLVGARAGVVEVPGGEYLDVTPPPPWTRGPIRVARSAAIKWRPVVEVRESPAPPPMIAAVVVASPPRVALRVVAAPAVPTPPCSSCPLRSGCRAICAELAAELPPEEVDTHREIAKAPDIVDFLASVQHVAEQEPETDDGAALRGLGWDELVAASRDDLQRAIDEALTDTQRQLVLSLLAGARPIDVVRRWRVSKPTVSILLRRARARLGAALGSAPRFTTRRGAQ